MIPRWRRPGDRPDDSVLVLAEAVLRLLGELAAPGLLLVLEDLHWADPETLAVVEFLADNIGHTALVLTARDEPGDAARLVETLARRGACIAWFLDPLSPAETDAMIDACAPGFSDRAVVRERSGGVPLLVEELLAEPGTVPRSVADSVRSRLADLPGSVRDALAVAAVLGERFDWRVLAVATSQEEPVTLDSIRIAIRSHLMDSADAADEFRFRHALLRDAVLGELLPPERRRWAGRALAAVRGLHPELDGSWCDVAVDLALAAGDRPAAAEILLEAGRRNLARGALETSETTLRRARTMGDGVDEDVDEVLAEVLVSAGKTEEAAEIDRRLLDADPTATASRVRLARTYARAGRWADAEDQLRKVPSTGDIGMQATIVRANVALEDARPDDAQRLAIDADTHGAPQVRVEAQLLLSRLARRSDLDKAEEFARRAQSLAEAHGLAHAAARAAYERAISGVQETLRVDLLQEARERMRSVGDLASVAVLDLQEVALRNARWEPEEAMAAASRCITASRRLRLATLPKALVLDAGARAYTGDAAGAELAEALDLAPDDTHLHGEVWGVRAMSSLERGDDQTAHQQLEQAMTLFARRPDEVTGSPAVGLWLLTSMICDPACHAVPPPPDPITNRWNRGMMLFAEAVSCGRRGDPAGVAQAFDAAEETMRRPVDIGWHRLQARRLVASAALADGWGDPTRWLLEDLPQVEDRGRQRWATQLRSQLRRAGVSLPRRSGESVPPFLRGRGVTAREAEVLELVEAGLDNHEIAHRLVLSVRTVEKHVERLLAKTGTSRRSSLIAEVARIRQGP